MSETVRDVVMRISVTGGNMTVGPIDVSAVKASLDSLGRDGAIAINQITEKVNVARASIQTLGESLGVAREGSSGSSAAVSTNAATANVKTAQQAGTTAIVNSVNRVAAAVNNLGSSIATGALSGANATGALRTQGVQGPNVNVGQIGTLITTIGRAAGTFAGVVTSIVAVGVSAITHFVGVTTSLTKRYWEEMSEDARRVSQLRSARIQNQASATVAMSRLPDTNEIKRIPRDIESHGRFEAGRRKVEEDWTRTPEQKREFRTYSEGLEARAGDLSAARDEQAYLKKRSDALKEGQAEQSARVKEANDARANERSALNKELNTRVYGRTDFLGVVGAVATGGWSLHSGNLAEQTRREQVQEKIKQVDIDVAKDQSTIDRSGVEVAKETLAIQQQLVQAKAREYTILRDSLQAARDRVHAEKETVKANEVSFGMQAEGEQNREIALQAKHERIKKQREENVKAGRDENFEVERYTQMEKQLGAQTDNIAMETIEKQAQEDAKKRGVKRRSANQDTLAVKEAELNRIEKVATPRMNELKGMLEKAPPIAEDLAERVVTAMKKAFATQDALVEVEKKLADLQATNASKQFVRQKTWGF